MTPASPPMTVPAAWVAHLASVVRQYDVAPQRLLAEHGLVLEALSAPALRVPVQTFVALLERARALSREPALGVQLGLQTRATLWGTLGFATLSAPTMREALELAVRYCALVSPAVGLRLREHAGEVEIALDEHVDFGSARDVVVLWLLIGVWRTGMAMVGSPPTARCELALAQPAYLTSETLPELPMKFGCSGHRLIVPSSRLAAPYALQDPSAMRTAIELCEQQRAALGLGESLAGRVRAMLGLARGGLPSLRELAGSMGMSTRTLTRRLADEQTSYLALREQERRERALTLSLSERSLAEMADELAYSTVANFERAFRRWHGCTPTQYRLAHRRAGKR